MKYLLPLLLSLSSIFAQTTPRVTSIIPIGVGNSGGTGSGGSLSMTNREFTSGIWYSNDYGSTIQVSELVQLNAPSSTGGSCLMKLWIVGAATNQVYLNVNAGVSSSITEFKTLSGLIPTNGMFTFTNFSGGSGTATMVSGAGQVLFGGAGGSGGSSTPFDASIARDYNGTFTGSGLGMTNVPNLWPQSLVADTNTLWVSSLTTISSAYYGSNVDMSANNGPWRWSGKAYTNGTCGMYLAQIPDVWAGNWIITNAAHPNNDQVNGNILIYYSGTPPLNFNPADPGWSDANGSPTISTIWGTNTVNGNSIVGTDYNNRNGQGTPNIGKTSLVKFTGDGSGLTNVQMAGVIGLTNLNPVSPQLTNSAAILTNLPGTGFINHFQQVPSLHMNNFPVYLDTLTEAQLLAEVNKLASWRTNGWDTVEWDDGWQSNFRDGNGNLIATNTLVPDGMPYVISNCHRLNMKIRLYTSMSGATCANHMGTPLDKAYQDTYLICGWGADGWKTDRCFNQYNNSQYEQWIRLANQAFSDYYSRQVASKTANPPSFYIHVASVGQWSDSYMTPALMQEANSIEIIWWGSSANNGIPDSQSSDGIWYTAHTLVRYNNMVGPGHFLGPMNLWFISPSADHQGWKNNQYITNTVNVGIMLCSPIQLDSAFAAATNQPAMMANHELWAIHQNPLVVPASIIWTNGSTSTPAEIWSRPLIQNNHERAMMFWNSNTVPVSITANSGMMGDTLNTVYYLRDPWNNVNLGKFTNSFSFTVQPTNTLMFKVKAVEQYEMQ